MVDIEGRFLPLSNSEITNIILLYYSPN